MLSFKHSGNAGDIIYSLPAVRALAIGGAALYLAKAAHTRLPMNAAMLSNFRELLLAQPYIRKLELHTGQAVCYDLDGFWHMLTPEPMHQQRSLIQCSLRWFGLSDRYADEAWLTVEPRCVAPVVINRTPRYRNEHFPWAKVYAKHAASAVFVGCADDHLEFEATVGPIPHYLTRDLHELAQVIAGADLFIGNQSCAHAIAEGLKKRVIIETPLGAHPAAGRNRVGCQYVVGERVEL